MPLRNTAAVPNVVYKLISKKYLTSAVAAAWQQQPDAAIRRRLADHLDGVAYEILPANFDDRERQEICAELTTDTLDDLRVYPAIDSPEKVASPATVPTEQPAPVGTIAAHPVLLAIPPLTADEVALRRERVRTYGQTEKIEVWNGEIVAGYEEYVALMAEQA